MTRTEAVEFIGISRSTLQRRVDLYLAGHTGDPRALVGRRRRAVGHRQGEREVLRADAERMRAQVAGELSPDVTAEQYARGVRTPA